jgi:hypothetical protein
MDAKVDPFIANPLGPLLLPSFSAGKCSLPVHAPSSSKNVNFANGQTDRILVPYCTLCGKNAAKITRLHRYLTSLKYAFNQGDEDGDEEGDGKGTTRFNLQNNKSAIERNCGERRRYLSRSALG